jgi:hypothetical protein
MSSLQKFHRRTNKGVGLASILFPTVGSGSDTIGYRLGYTSGSTAYLVTAPKSTEVQRVWGSNGTVRGTVSTTDGLSNTNTLYAFGSAAHPAAYYAKTLATGGYNTWYLPAKDELMTMYSNKSATPFATANSFVPGGQYYWSSTEFDSTFPWIQSLGGGSVYGKYGNTKDTITTYVRAIRILPI